MANKKPMLSYAEKNIQKTKTLSIVFLSIMLFLVLLFFMNQLSAFFNPAGHNYMIERLKEGDAVDAYLYTAENIISLIWMGILGLYLVAFLIMVIKRKNAMHLAMLILGMCLFSGYALTRLIFCYAQGSTSIIVGLFYTVSFIASLGMIYWVFKRGIDGDATLPYYVFAIICFATFFFASATKSSYSLLNAFSHITTIIDDYDTMASHTIADVVYWGGYATTRLFVLTYAFVLFGNMNFVYNEDKVLEEAKEAKAVSE